MLHMRMTRGTRIIFCVGFCTPYPALDFLFLCCEAKKKKTKRKEKETRRLHTVAKFNPRFANSSFHDSDSAHLVAVSLSDSNRNVRLVCWCLFSWITVLRTRMTRGVCLRD